MYSEILTKEARNIAMKDQNMKNLTLDMKENELYFVGQHIWLNVQVFINPTVGHLPDDCIQTPRLSSLSFLIVRTSRNIPPLGGIFARSQSLICRGEFIVSFIYPKVDV